MQEISISDFMQGLESLVGTDLRGPPRDLDVASLSFRLKAKTRGSRSDGALPLPALGGDVEMRVESSYCHVDVDLYVYV